MDIAQGLPLWVGSSLLLLSAACILRPQAWVALYERIYQAGEAAAIPCGALNIFFGALVLTFHWEWSGWAVVLSLIGAVALAEGFAFVLFPQLFVWALGVFAAEENQSSREKMFRLAGIVKLLLALAMLREWQTQPPLP